MSDLGATSIPGAIVGTDAAVASSFSAPIVEVVMGSDAEGVVRLSPVPVLLVGVGVALRVGVGVAVAVGTAVRGGRVGLTTGVGTEVSGSRGGSPTGSPIGGATSARSRSAC